MIPDVEGLAHGASGEFAAVAVTTCPLQGAPSARPRSRRTQGDAASGSPLPTVPSVEESAQEGPTPPVWGSPSDGAGSWDPWPPPSAIRQECAHEARGGVHGLRATAWVRIPPPLRGRLQWAGHEDHTGPESCHCALTSPPPAAPWAAAGEETGSRAPRERVRAGPAPGILTPGPVAGRQEVGKPASTNFNTTGHVTDWSPHAAAPGRARRAVYPPGHATRSRPQPRLGVTAPLPLPPSALSPVLRDTKDRGGAPSEVQSCPPQPASHPRARLQARARSLGAEAVSGAGSLRSGRGQAGRARTSGTRSASDAGGLARTGDAACPRGCQAPRAPRAPRRPGPRGPHGPSHRTRTAGRAERGGQGRRPPLEGTPAPGTWSH